MQLNISVAQAAPAVLGYYELMQVRGTGIWLCNNPSGAFYYAWGTNNKGPVLEQGTPVNPYQQVYFDASRSNSVYNGQDVRPTSRTCKFFIKY